MTPCRSICSLRSLTILTGRVKSSGLVSASQLPISQREDFSHHWLYVQICGTHTQLIVACIANEKDNSWHFHPFWLSCDQGSLKTSLTIDGTQTTLISWHSIWLEVLCPVSFIGCVYISWLREDATYSVSCGSRIASRKSLSQVLTMANS